MKSSVPCVAKLSVSVISLAFCFYFYLPRREIVIYVNRSILSNPQNTNISAHSNVKNTFKENFTKQYSQNETSTCSESIHRGFHQKVIAFSLYGPFNEPSHFNRYGKTFQVAVRQINEMYPGWIIRVYHNYHDAKDPNYLKLQQLVEGYSNVDFCNATQTLEEKQLNVNTFEMNWRFLPLLDPAVDWFMSRDADCYIFQREVDAVNHWLEQKANSTFHIMRDHPLHESQFLGGLWGAKLHQRRSDIEKAMTKMLKRKPQNGKGMDQLLLGMYIWPLALQDMVAHDSYLCRKYPSTQPFPTRREGGLFVGMIVDGNLPIGTAEICPEPCRPVEHKDWMYC